MLDEFDFKMNLYIDMNAASCHFYQVKFHYFS